MAAVDQVAVGAVQFHCVEAKPFGACRSRCIGGDGGVDVGNRHLAAEGTADAIEAGRAFRMGFVAVERVDGRADVP